jgi:DNA-binding protein H-NS
MKTLLTSLLLTMFFTFSYCQPNKNFTIANRLKITVSNKLEMQRGIAKVISDKYSEHIAKVVFNDSNAKPQIVWQQKGINEQVKAAFKTFVRLIVVIDILKGSENSSALNPIKTTKLELLEIGNKYQKSIAESSKMEASELIGNVQAMTQKIGKYYSVCIFWQVKNANYGSINYSTYTLIHKGRQFTITTIYRVSDKSTWKPVLDSALNSIGLLD